MGQKVNPNGFRLGIIKVGNHYGTDLKEYRKYILEDNRIREYIKKSTLIQVYRQLILKGWENVFV